MIGAIISRAEAQVLRLSLLYALLDRSAVIRPAHLKAALALWEYAEASARRIFSGPLGLSTADTILEALKTRGPMKKTAISELFGRHKAATDIDAALNHLAEAGKAQVRKEGSGGRSAEVWETVG